jgi:predicted ATP-binding protein involved in virulence
MNTTTELLKDIDLTLTPITIFTGTNGCGKTKLLETIYNQLKVNEDLVLFYPIDRGRSNPEGSFSCFLLRHYEERLDLINRIIPKFLPSIKQLREDNKRLVIDKDNLTIEFRDLSKGEYKLLTVLGDIFYNLSKLQSINPLRAEAIVLIDEIELHLHPSIQANICSLLRTTFYNCRFILTTNSPLTLNNERELIVYKLEQGKIRQINLQYGEDVNTVLLQVFNTSSRNEATQIELNDLLDLIQSNELNKAKELIEELKGKLSLNNVELIKANLLLKKQQLK